MYNLLDGFSTGCIALQKEHGLNCVSLDCRSSIGCFMAEADKQEDPVAELEKMLFDKGFSIRDKLEVDTRPLTTNEESRKTRRKKKYEKEVSRFFVFSQVI